MTYLPIRRFTVANLPSASNSDNKSVIVTNEVGGEVTAVSDGTNWRRVTDNRIVQAFPTAIIINGQSNAAAVPRGTLGSSASSRHLGTDLLSWGEVAGSFVQMVDGHANAKSTNGPGGGVIGSLLMRRLADASGNTIRSYNLAYTSQSVSYFEPNSVTNAFFSDATQHGSLNNYDLLVDYVTTGGIIPELYVWIQGEADSGVEQSTYYTSLKAIYDQSQIDYPGIKWAIVSTIGNAQSRGAGQSPILGVRAAQKQLADENPDTIYYIDTTDMEGATAYFDGVHYTYYAGYEEVAERIFSAIKGETRNSVEPLSHITDVISWTEFFTNRNTVSGGNVTQWQTDISPFTTVMVPNTNAPAHVAADSDFNDRTAIDFDDTNGETLRVTGLTAESDWTLFAVAKIDTLGANQYLFTVQDAGSANRSSLIAVGGSNAHTYFYGGGSFTFSTSLTASTVGVHTYCYVLNTTDRVVELYVDGAFIGSSSIAGTQIGMTDVWLGSLVGTGILKGKVSAFGFAQGVIATPSQIADMHSWATAEYGLPQSLSDRVENKVDTLSSQVLSEPDKIQVVDARDFGALGDGATDDSNALEAWAAACSVATINNPVIARARGDFRFASELKFVPSGNSGTIHFDLEGASFTWTSGEGIAATESFTFSNSARTITRSSGDFVTDGFTTNRWIEVSGSQLNDGRYWVTNVTSSVITVDVDIFTASPLTDETISCTVRDRLVWFRLGDGQTNNKWFYSSMTGLYLAQTTNFSNCTGIEIDHCDFFTMNNCVLSVGGGLASGSRCLDISGFSKQGNGSANSVTITSLLTGGSEEGIFVDESNVFTLRGGKIQQHATGFTVRKSSVVQIHTVDFSLNTQNAVFCDNTGAIDFHNVYAEQNGPGTRGNDAKLFYLKDCRGVSFTGCNFNGTNGAVSDGTHPGYGVYLEGTDGVHISGSSGKLCQRALVYCDSACRDIVLDPSFVFEVGSGWSHNSLQPIIDESRLLINRAQGRALTPLPEGLTNLISVTDVSDDGYWIRENGVTFEGKVSSEDRTTSVPIIGLSDVSATTSKVVYTTDNLSNLAGKTLYFRVKTKLIDFQEPVIANRTTDLAVIRLIITRTTGGANVASGLLRLGEVWDWYEVSWSNLPANDTYELTIEVRQAQEPINIAVEDVQAYLVQDDYVIREPDYFNNLFAWYDAGVGVEEASGDPAENGDAVEFWRDQGPDGYDLTEATLGDRPTFTAVSSVNSQPEITFNGSTSELSSDEAASIWNFMHDGTGCTILMAIRPDSGSFVMDTNNASANNSGLNMDFQSPDDLRIRIGNGSGSFISNLTTTTGILPTTGAIISIRHGSGQSPNVDIRSNGSEVITGNYLDTPSSSDANNTLVLGARGAGDLNWQGGLLEIAFYDRTLDDTELNYIENYMRDKYGFF